MKRYLVKGAAFLLALSIGGSLLAGCGGKQNTGAEPTSTAAKATASAVDQQKPVELSVEVFERGNQGEPPADNNYWTKWIQENFKKDSNINVTFVPVLRSEETNKLNVLMAANQAPDICFTYDSSLAAKYAKSGGIQELSASIEKYGKDLTAFLGQDVLDYGIFYGKQYAVPSRRILVGVSETLIRKDWLDKLGLDVPTNKDEFYTVMKAFKEKDPAGQGQTIPFGIGMQEMSFGCYNMMYTFFDKMTEEDWYTKNQYTYPGVKNYYQYLNKLYNEGLISPEFALDKDIKKLQADISNGKVGFFYGNLGLSTQPSPGLLQALKKNNPAAEYVACDPFVNSEGKRLKLGYSPAGMYTMVPTTCKNADAAVKYLNWLSKAEVIKTLQNGIENETYSIVDGIPVVNKDYKGEKKLVNGTNFDYVLTSNGKNVGDQELNIKAESFNHPGFEKLFVESYKIATTDTLIGPNWKGFVNEANAKYSTTLFNKYREGITKLILCKPSEFDKTFTEVLNDYQKSGGQEVTDENIKLYKELKQSK